MPQQFCWTFSILSFHYQAVGGSRAFVRMKNSTKRLTYTGLRSGSVRFRRYLYGIGAVRSFRVVPPF